MNEATFEVRGSDGLVRRGIVSLSASASPNAQAIGLILMPAGMKYHAGPHRYYVRLARSLARHGLAVLRIDPLGLGESDGVLDGGDIRDLWRSVETGRFVQDALLSAESFREQYHLRTLVMGGICGGAITSQLSAAKKPDLIDGVISINTASTLSRLNDSSGKMITDSRVRYHFRSYLKKISSGYAWKRLLVGESDLGSIKAVVFNMIRNLFSPSDHEQAAECGNPLFIKSFKALMDRHIPHLLLFGEKDGRWLDFQDVYFNPYLAGKLTGSSYEICVIPDANHEFYLNEWQRTAEQSIIDWIKKNAF